MVETRSRTSRTSGAATTRAAAAASSRPLAVGTGASGAARTSGTGSGPGGGAGGTGTNAGGRAAASTSMAAPTSTQVRGGAGHAKTGSGGGAGAAARRVPSAAGSTAGAAAGHANARHSARSSTASTRQQSTLANNPVPPQMTSTANPRPATRSSIVQQHPRASTGAYSQARESARLSSHTQATPVAGGSGTAAGPSSASSHHHSYNTRKNNAVHTVNELIAGKIQQVYVLEDDEDEEDRPPSASASLAAHQQANGSYSHNQYQPHPYHPSGGAPLPPVRTLTAEYPLHYASSRGQAGGVSVASAYRPSPRLNGSVLRGASAVSGRSSAIPGQHLPYPPGSSNLGPSAGAQASGKGKRKARDEGTAAQAYYANSHAAGSQYGVASANSSHHLLPGTGNASSPAAGSSNRYSQSIGMTVPAPPGSLDRAMQAQHRAAAAAAAAAVAASGGGSTADLLHYAGSQVHGPDVSSSQTSSAAGSAAAAAAAAASKRRRRDADGNYATAGGTSAYHHPQQPPPGPYVGSGNALSSRHAGGAGGYFASPATGAGTGAAYVPLAGSSGGPVAAPASYRGGYPAGQGYVETQYGTDLGAGGAGAVGAVPAAEELPCDDKEGHYIVRPGEFVGSRYRIVGLLGQGTFGKVVECVDVRSRRHVAVKVIRAIQKYRDASQIEIRVLKTLKDHDPLNEHQCIHLIEHFSFRNHVCIVSELLGKSVFDFLKENDFAPFPSMHIWSFAKQLLKSVAFLHRLGLIHTDLKPENILLVSSDHTTVRTNASMSGGGSASRRQPKMRNMLRSTEIRLIDFGSATFDHEYHSAVVSTRHYRAPEIILGMGWSFPCDAWSIGCILVEFLTGDALFQTHDNLEHLAMMEAVLGVMPEDYRRQAEQYKPELFRHGRLNFPNPDVPKQSKRYVRQMKKLQDIIGGAGGSGGGTNATYSKHNTRFVHLVRRLLEFDPQRRITVSDALNHPYFDLVEHEFPP